MSAALAACPRQGFQKSCVLGFSCGLLAILAAATALVSGAGLAEAGPFTGHSPPVQIRSAITLVAVFGDDQRQPLPADRSGIATKIGTLTARKTGAVCTAFCVAPDAIATASHCLFGTSSSAKPDLTQLQFKLSPSGESSALAGAKSGDWRHNIVSGTQNLSVTPPIDAANDWAIARLDVPICRGGGLPVSQKSRAEIDEIANAGGVYEIAIHRDLPAITLMLGQPCALPEAFPQADRAVIARDFSNPGSILFHTCDTGGGSSGSPLLIDGIDGPEVIGINVGTYVLSRMVMKASGEPQSETSEAIANTAVAAGQFSGAVREMSLGPPLAAARNASVIPATGPTVGHNAGRAAGRTFKR